MEIGGQTRLVAIVGDPVAHSRSPAMHNAAFRALGLDLAYVALRVSPESLRAAIGGVRALGFAGLNVTVPHKQAIVPLLDRVTPRARAIGAVNTVVRRGRALEGDNTDAEGFLRSLSRLRFRARGRSVVILGAGGSARAVVWALAGAGAARIRILNRTPRRALSVAALARGRATVEVGPLESAAEPAVVEGADLVVNCTSLGLDGRSAPSVAVEATPERCLFYDLVYGAAQTPFVRAARRRRRRAVDGKSMLVEQAAAAFRLWTGRRAPIETMSAALD